MVVGDIIHDIAYYSCLASVQWYSKVCERNRILMEVEMLGVIVITEFFLKFNFNLIRCVSTCLCQDI